jgi:hypothetical protein
MASTNGEELTTFLAQKKLPTPYQKEASKHPTLYCLPRSNPRIQTLTAYDTYQCWYKFDIHQDNYTPHNHQVQRNNLEVSFNDRYMYLVQPRHIAFRTERSLLPLACPIPQ